jgi:type II secretory pathway pseudopilin PulG
MRYRNRKIRSRLTPLHGLRPRRGGLTILEIIIALAIITIIFAVVLPQFRVILTGWDYRQANTEVIQNGRVLIDHISRNLSKAVKITAVEPNEYIQFLDNDSNTYQYDINPVGSYVRYGRVGYTLSDLAGPVSSLTFNCYDVCDLNKPLSSPIDVNYIRLVKVHTTVLNSADNSQNKTFTASIYLRTNAYNGGLIGCWKLDETSGTTAVDSSGTGNDGNLVNMTPSGCWVSGQIGNALAFDGTDDFVQVANLSNQLGANYTISWWAEPNQIAVKENILLGTDSTSHDFEYYQNNTNLCVRADAGSSDDITVNNVFTVGQWVHICGVGDANGTGVYVNGTLAGTTTVKKNTTSNYNLNIGAYPSGANSFNGTIDDVRIFNRALSTAEIATLANILTYRGFSEGKAPSDSNTTIVIPKPNGTTPNDLLIAAVATDEDTSSTLAPLGSVWTQINLGACSSQVTLGAWWKIASDSEPINYTFNWSTPEKAYGWIMRFTGQHSDIPINDYLASGQSSITPTSPEVTITVNNCLILRLGAFDNDDVNTLPEPGNPGLSGHTAITMDTSGGSATPVGKGSWVTGLTHDKETGTNRALVFVAHAKPGNNPTLTAVSYGGQSMTKVIEQEGGNGSNRTYVEAFILNDAGITAATTTTFTITWSSSPGSNVTYSSVFLQNVNQTTLTGDSAGNQVSDTTITTSALATVNGEDMVIESAACNATGTYTMNNSFTNDIDLSVTGYDGMDGHKLATGVSETPSVTHESGRQVLIGFVVKGAGLITGTVSGGAGYIKQASAGGSGQSNFQLTALQAARMLTIAIAPADNNNCDCSRDYIQP